MKSDSNLFRSDIQSLLSFHVHVLHHPIQIPSPSLSKKQKQNNNNNMNWIRTCVHAISSHFYHFRGMFCITLYKYLPISYQLITLTLNCCIASLLQFSKCINRQAVNTKKSKCRLQTIPVDDNSKDFTLNTYFPIDSSLFHISLLSF